MEFHQPPHSAVQQASLLDQRIGRAMASLWLIGLAPLVVGLGSNLILSPAAQACETSTATPNPSPVDLSQLSAEQQRQLEATVQERRALLPYQFLSPYRYRCPTLTDQAIQAFEQQDYAQTLALFDQTIAKYPNSPEPWLNRAMLHYYLGYESAARSDAQQVCHLLANFRSPQTQEAYRRLMITIDGKVPDPRQAVELPIKKASTH
jgi:hypothetical protein